MRKSLLTAIGLLALVSCFSQTAFDHPSWVRRANIYEVNVRQYTPQGTFKAFSKHLDRLNAMGVQILWFMPINPISKTDRKGTLGSYYAVSDYTTVNPEFGTLADFRTLVASAHAKGMKVILDWVPNHTGADHRWLVQHPDFYKKDSSGKAAVPFDWTDTRQLNYDNPVLRDSMIAAMQYWVRQTNIDGFRCDVAWNVPGDFWKTCISRLRQMKSLFFLAEGDKPYLASSGFDALYPWDFFHKMIDVAKGERPAFALDSVLQQFDTAYPAGTLEMFFTSNHDENSWNGADYQTFPGAAHAPFAVLSQTLPWDIPLIYSGQEEPVLRALSFFEKDSISFRHFGRAAFYKTLLALRKRNPALDADAGFKKIDAGDPRYVYAFLREKAGQRVLVLLNLSPNPQTMEVHYGPRNDYPTDVFADKTVAVNRDHWTLEPWGYRVYEYPYQDTVPNPPHVLNFRTRKDQRIAVHEGNISVNGKTLYHTEYDDVIYTSKLSRVIEDKGSVFLFLEYDGSPNEDRFKVFKVTDTKIDSVCDVVSSEIADMDGDGNLEFGGSDLTEEYPQRDSMYYIPCDFYEIRNGRVVYDSSFTRKADRQLNGVYLTNRGHIGGMCCKVIPKPGKKNTSVIVDTSLVSERIDGPANIRDTIDGKLLFVLNDNVPVNTSDSAHRHYPIRLLVDLTPEQLRTMTIRKGSPIIVDGQPVGTALEDCTVRPAHIRNEPSKAILSGYTTVNNIRPQTMPEKILSRIIRANGPMDISDLDYFDEAFRLGGIANRPYRGIDLVDRLMPDGTFPIRILLIFEGRMLYAVIHARKMDYHGSAEYPLNRGCTLTVVGRQPQPLIDRLIKDFNSFNP